MYTIIPLLHVFSSKLVMWLYPLSSNSTKSGLSPSFGRASMIQIRSGFSSAAMALHSGILFLKVSAFSSLGFFTMLFYLIPISYLSSAFLTSACSESL